MDSVTFMLSGMSLEVSPICLQLQQLVTFDVLSQEIKCCGANVWRHLEVVKEVKVHAFWTFVMCWVTFTERHGVVLTTWGNAGFKLSSGQLLFLPRYFVVYIISSMWMPEWHIKLRHDRFFVHAFQCIIHSSLQRMYWIIGRKSKLSLTNKLLMYKIILKPIWTYGVPLWEQHPNQTSKYYKEYRTKFSGWRPTHRGTYPTICYTLIYKYQL